MSDIGKRALTQTDYVLGSYRAMLIANFGGLPQAIVHQATSRGYQSLRCNLKAQKQGYSNQGRYIYMYTLERPEMGGIKGPQLRFAEHLGASSGSWGFQ